MKFRHELRFDAPPAKVIAMRTDPGYRVRLAAEAGVSDSQTTVTEEDGTTVVRVEEQRPTQGVPGFAKKIVGDFTHTIIHETWTGTAGTFEVETPGKPMHIAGSISVAPSGESTIVVFDLEATASVPIIGGKLEKLTADLTEEGLVIEQRVGAEWLTEQDSKGRS